MNKLKIFAQWFTENKTYIIYCKLQIKIYKIFENNIV